MAEERKKKKSSAEEEKGFHIRLIFFFLYFVHVFFYYYYSVQIADFHLILPTKMTGIVFSLYYVALRDVFFDLSWLRTVNCSKELAALPDDKIYHEFAPLIEQWDL